LSRKELDQEVVAGLSKSFKVLRPVYPIVKAEDGEIIDGFHRREAAPITYERYCVTLKGVKSEKEKLLYRMHLNYRRKVTKEERKKQLTRLAEILEKEGVTREEMVSELAKITPFQERWIRELLPDKYKMVERAPKKEATKKEAASMPHIEKPRVEVHEHKPKPVETWEQREAVMHPAKSRLEVEAVTELMAEGLPLEMDREFCLLATTPDAYCPSKKLAFYIDGPVHAGREERDAELRELLWKRHGIKPVSIRYESYSKEAKEQVKREIRRILEEG